ncbi:MAG: insulinase family protein [Deltaproteobacteria bacterium]|nr:insulinase family protein [Deltaproteobacteria bacterium]
MTGCQKSKIVEDRYGIYKTHLENGLTVIIQENHKQPLVTLLTRVKVGYFQEPDHLTGISHLLEHMYFKGTVKRPETELWPQEARSYGANTNAWTNYEETAYHLTLPSDYFEQGLELHADALFNMKLDPTELVKETEVVIQEGKRKKDTPSQMTHELLKSIAFSEHRLKRWRIGTEEGLRNLTRQDVLTFYKTHYLPSNMILTLVGDINAKEVLKAVRKYFKLPSTEPPSFPATPTEPLQTAFRFDRQFSDIKTSYLAMGFHTAPIFHEDTYALQMIAELLNRGKSSRLIEALKHKRQLVYAVETRLELFSTIGFLNVHAQLHTKNILETERAILSQLERLKTTLVPQTELEKIKLQLHTEFLLSQETTMGIAEKLSYFEHYGGHDRFYDYIPRLYAVTPQEIQKIAQKYFSFDRLSAFEYFPRTEMAYRISKKSLEQDLKKILKTSEKQPTEEEKISSMPISEPPPPTLPFNLAYLKATHPFQDNIPKRFQLSNDAILLLRENHALPLVAVQIYFKGGRLYESKKNSGITQLLVRSSGTGTTTLLESEILTRLDAMGATLETICEPDFFGWKLLVPIPFLDPALKIVSDVIQNPSFQAPMVQREKDLLVSELIAEEDRPFPYTLQLFREAAFKNHPYGLPNLGLLNAIENIKIEDLIAWHLRWINGHNMVIGVAGDIQPLDTRALIENHFKNISARGIQYPKISEVELPDFISENFKMREKEQTSMVIGFQGVPVTHPDFAGLRTLATLTSGLSGRFVLRLRVKEKLSYVTQSLLFSNLKGGAFLTYTAVSPENEKKALRYLLEEYKRLRDEPITREELRTAQHVIASELIQNAQKISFQAYDDSWNELSGKGPRAEIQFLENVRALSPEKLNELALIYFKLDQYTLGVVRGNPQSQSVISQPPKPIVVPKPKPKISPERPMPAPPPPKGPEKPLSESQ